MASLSPGSHRRYATAAVELAVVLIPIMVLLVGILEMGRYIQVAQIMTNAAREGARLAAQGVNVQTRGNFVYIYTDPTSTLVPNTNPRYVSDVVKNYLIVGGITNLTGLRVEFKFLSPAANPPSQMGVGTSDDTSRTDPWQGTKDDAFRLFVSLPYKNFQWTNINWFNITDLNREVRWGMAVDDPLTVNVTIPGWNGP